MAGSLERRIGLPFLCIVGEPTSMKIVTGHKGKVPREVIFMGSAGHSAAAPGSVNALHLARDLIGMLRHMQDEIAVAGFRSKRFAVRYSTIHVQNLTGGSALNMIPETALLQFEMRHLAGEDVEALLTGIKMPPLGTRQKRGRSSASRQGRLRHRRRCDRCPGRSSPCLRPG